MGTHVPPIPRPPILNAGELTVADQIAQIQSYIEAFEYNYTGKPFVPMKKSRGMEHIRSVSRQLMQVSLPIQCVEAVFLGTYLTAGMELERVPLSFKTKFLRGTVHQHIVLALRHNGKWGAMGISRRSNLMKKDMMFATLADLVEDFRIEYEVCFHKLLTVYIGLPLPHNVMANEAIKWRAVKVRVFARDAVDVASRIDNFEATMATLNEHFQSGTLPG